MSSEVWCQPCNCTQKHNEFILPLKKKHKKQWIKKTDNDVLNKKEINNLITQPPCCKEDIVKIKPRVCVSNEIARVSIIAT